MSGDSESKAWCIPNRGIYGGELSASCFDASAPWNESPVPIR